MTRVPPEAAPAPAPPPGHPPRAARPARHAGTHPSPWRMAELEELVHAVENRRRENDLRERAQPGPPDAPPRAA